MKIMATIQLLILSFRRKQNADLKILVINNSLNYNRVDNFPYDKRLFERVEFFEILNQIVVITLSY